MTPFYKLPNSVITVFLTPTDRPETETCTHKVLNSGTFFWEVWEERTRKYLGEGLGQRCEPCVHYQGFTHKFPFVRKYIFKKKLFWLHQIFVAACGILFS